jgi:EAL domain-containing protein (putative c-di-GMP-specific phosphodiesterase class I)/GGDEF domain-containing protein
MTTTRRLSLLVASLLLLVLTGGLTIQTLGVRQVLQWQQDDRNREAATVLAQALSLLHGDVKAMQALAQTQFVRARQLHIGLRRPDGRVLIELNQPAPPTLAPDWFVAALPITAVAGQAWVTDGKGELGVLHLQSSPAWAHNALWAVCTRTVALLAALLAGTAVAAGVMLRAWQQPLQALVAQAQALEGGRFVETREPRRPELRTLTRSMNAISLRLRDVFASQAEQVALLQRQAQIDLVTGLPLRRYFVGRLNDQLAEPGGPGAALILVRVLRLDALNQRLGRDATDRLLGAIAGLLQTYVERVPGTFAGRLNGSDFGLCLPVAGLAAETAESLHAALTAAPVLHAGGAQLVLGGVDGLRHLNEGVALAAADVALAQAEAGTGLAIVQQGEALAGAGGAGAWREQIETALAEGRARIAGFPAIGREGQLIHLECPLRVQLSPGGDYQDAARWLALARRSRLMPQVDLAALDLALQAIAADQQPRAVHVAQASLVAPGFVAEVTARLAAAPQSAARLSIEWGDDARPADRSALAAAAARWRILGVRLGVEHAGAEAQRLTGLHDIGIDYVKVDARHLRGAATDAAMRAYALGLVALIHGLGLAALAEGVADADDLAAMWDLGFDGATGPAVHAP